MDRSYNDFEELIDIVNRTEREDLKINELYFGEGNDFISQ